MRRIFVIGSAPPTLTGPPRRLGLRLCTGPPPPSRGQEIITTASSSSSAETMVASRLNPSSCWSGVALVERNSSPPSDDLTLVERAVSRPRKARGSRQGARSRSAGAVAWARCEERHAVATTRAVPRRRARRGERNEQTHPNPPTHPPTPPTTHPPPTHPPTHHPGPTKRLPTHPLFQERTC